MNRSGFVRAVASDCYESIEIVDGVLRSVENVLVKTLSSGEEVKLFSGFKLVPKELEERESYVPTKGINVVVPAHKVCKLRTTEVFTGRINKKDGSDIEE